MLFLWFYHACKRGSPRFLMVADHVNYLTFEDPGAVNTVRRALKLAHAGDLHGAAEVAGVDVAHAAVVSEGLRRGMRFSIGAELDNDPRSRPDAQNIVDAMRPDGLIRSVHFLPIEHPEKGADWMWPFDNAEFAQFFEVVGVEPTWELYMRRLLEDIEKLPGHVVGHFYAPASFGHWPDLKTLEAHEDRLIAACLARGMAVELNLRFLYRDHPDDQKQRYRQANLRLLKKAAAAGVGIAIGSGAHSPKDQGAAFDVALAMLDECEVNELVFPVNGRLARVALRATKEHLERHARKETVAAPGSSISGYGRAELGLPEHGPAASPARAQRDVGPKKRSAGPERTSRIATARGTSKTTPAEKLNLEQAKAAKVAAAKRAPTAGKAATRKAAALKAAAKKGAAKPAAAKSVAKKAPPAKAATAKAHAVKPGASAGKAVKGKAASTKAPSKTTPKTVALKGTASKPAGTRKSTPRKATPKLPTKAVKANARAPKPLAAKKSSARHVPAKPKTTKAKAKPAAKPAKPATKSKAAKASKTAHRKKPSTKRR
ncbi:MAG: PHP domain-containing protein [Vulcanimicrobiaceae bacterium]